MDKGDFRDCKFQSKLKNLQKPESIDLAVERLAHRSRVAVLLLPVLCQYFAISPRVVVARAQFHVTGLPPRSSGSVSTDSTGTYLLVRCQIREIDRVVVVVVVVVVDTGRK